MSRACARRRRRVHLPTRVATVVVTDGGAELTRWELRRASPVDLSLVDEIARLRLHARAMGYEVRVRDACSSLRQLVVLAGLGDVLDDGA
jgi:hypothetical protein